MHYYNPISITKLLNYSDEDIILADVTIKSIIKELLPAVEEASEKEDNAIKFIKITSSKALKSIKLLQIFWLQ